jgi:hypothetical protein
VHGLFGPNFLVGRIMTTNFFTVNQVINVIWRPCAAAHLPTPSGRPWKESIILHLKRKNQGVMRTTRQLPTYVWAKTEPELCICRQPTNKFFIFFRLFTISSLRLKKRSPWLEKTRAIDDCDKGGEGLIVPFSVRQTRIGTQ